MAEDILHFAGVRARISGSASVKARFLGLDNVIIGDLVPIPITNLPGREPMRLANFIGQRARLELKTTEINETMKVNRLVIYVKTLWSEYPNT